MTAQPLELIFAPNPIFKQRCEPVAVVNDEIRAIVDAMFETLRVEQAVGVGANMVGITKRIAIVDLKEGDLSHTHTFINPEIIWRSEEMQTFEEASLCFPGISVDITRPRAITLTYLDYDGKPQELKAEGFLATVIQHELDYLDGITFLDHLSPLKRDMMMKKVQKFLKLNPPHVHTEHCHH